MNKLLFILLSSVGLFFTMVGFNNCVRSVKYIEQKSLSDNSGGTTVGTPLVQFKFAPFTLAAQNQQITVCVDQIVLTLNDGKSTQVSVPLPAADKTLSSQGTLIGMNPLPAGEYRDIAIPLSTQCASQKSLQTTNTQGSFDSIETVSLHFSGQALVDQNLVSLSFNIQDLVNSLNGVSQNSVLAAVAEGTPGTWTTSTSNVWYETPALAAPSPRYNHTAVWTGAQMIIWGGWYDFETPSGRNSGGSYDPLTNTWTATTTISAPTARRYHTALWTGSRMLIWGGEDSSSFPLGDGAQYDPATNSWSPITTSGAPSARAHHTALWTGSKMLVWGGTASNGTLLNDGAQYDPATDTWSPITLSGAPGARVFHSAVWTGSKMLIWGGSTSPSTPLNDGGLYDPSTDSWQPIPSSSYATARYKHSAVWSGQEMLIWGGESYVPGSHFYLGDGARYNPATATWRAITSTNAPSERSEHTALWTGSKMMIWAGGGNASFLGTGAIYDPATDSWSPISSQNGPTARFYHSSIWTGTEMIIWGGWNNTVTPADMSSGGRYF
ncbi:MAG: Kelch repeat-containing protein [Pseudobdellovibrionaceae bacterium]